MNQCIMCHQELIPHIDNDPNGESNPECIRCRLESEHDFDAEPDAVYDRYGNKESISPEHHHRIRPLCECCGGRDHRKGYSHTKAKSHKLNKKARKPRYKDKRG